MSENAKAAGVNRAKLYQLVLFPLNNGATNVYYVLVLSYIATFGSNVLALGTLFASVMVTAMRLCDAITDPIIGALMDRTNGKFGKFRPFMAIGNLIMAVSILILYGITPMIPDTMMWARYAAFVGLYFVWVIGYTFQTSCTRSGQTVLTNDPKQRPLFTIFNTVGSLLGMGVMQFFAPILAKNFEGGYSSAGFFRTLAPVGIVMSIVLTILAIIGIWEKDQPKYFGIGGEKTEKVKVSEYLQIIKENKPMQRLMVAGAGTKLALSIANNTTVLCMLYGCMMGAYDGLYLPMMVLGYVFSVPFFLLSVRTSQKKGQKASLTKYVSVALVCYIGVFVLLALWGRGDAFHLSLMGENGLSINLYTVLFILFFGIGYGAYYATADMPIPMVADCSDYETYRSGKYIPGIMGTLFSLVDKLVSSLSATVVGIAVTFIGLNNLPTQYDPYTPGMNVVVIVLFCVIPMLAWAATLIAMKGYALTGEKMKEIQAINACRRDAVAGGMKLEDAINEGVRQGYVEGFLRKSVVGDPIIRENTKDNTPAVIHYSIVPGDKVEIKVAPKGFGSENMSRVFMLKPADGIEGVKEAILTAVREAGPNACPPMVVGVGIGGTFEKCALMAKEALTREAGSHSGTAWVKDLEEEMLETINKLGIGPGGLGGTTTALAVNVNTYPTHIAGLPVAVNICCHVNRHIIREV